MPEEYKHLSGAQEDYISKYGHKTEPVPVVCNPFIRIRTKKATHFHKNLSKMNGSPASLSICFLSINRLDFFRFVDYNRLCEFSREVFYENHHP